MKSSMEKIGVWAFVIGLVIAVIVALVSQKIEGNVVWILGALGIIVGLINISSKEVTTYLVASIALVVGSFGLMPMIGALGFAKGVLTALLNAIIIFVAPGAVVVAIKAIFGVAKSK